MESLLRAAHNLRSDSKSVSVWRHNLRSVCIETNVFCSNKSERRRFPHLRLAFSFRRCHALSPKQSPVLSRVHFGSISWPPATRPISQRFIALRAFSIIAFLQSIACDSLARYSLIPLPMSLHSWLHFAYHLRPLLRFHSFRFLTSLHSLQLEPGTHPKELHFVRFHSEGCVPSKKGLSSISPLRFHFFFLCLLVKQR